MTDLPAKILGAMAEFQARHNVRPAVIYLGTEQDREMEAWALQHATVAYAAAEKILRRRQFNGAQVFRVDSTNYLAVGP